MSNLDGRLRVVIEGVSPEIDCGRFPVKSTLGEVVAVEADIFADGHDALAGRLKFRHADAPSWSEVPMEPLVNDRWRAAFPVTQLGQYLFTVEGWVDHFLTWRRGLEKKVKAGVDVALDLLGGAAFAETAAQSANDKDADELRSAARALSASSEHGTADKVALALDPRLTELIQRHTSPSWVTQYARILPVLVEPERARFSAWFELFPRSTSPQPGAHGTFRDCEAWLPRIAAMGFDVLYLPPIHPIGRAYRKGKNNSLSPGPDEPGSPWAIGGPEGGHKSIHPQLGTLEEFKHLVEAARRLGIDIALDIALQCSPDHPYVREHPQWFRKRPDGSIQYAENPPKKYQDIYPLDFECADWRALWDELKSIFVFWITRGIRVFRVDNPHTKPFPFWEWCLGELKAEYPEVIFLSEAFTRPRTKYRLAKLGFSQSYNYFPWRNTKYELTQYLTELTQTDVRHFFRPNLWPNTPDILPQYLQYGGRAAFMIRFVLAATLSASYGIYGPAYIASESQPREPGSEEYLDSEKYEIRHWRLDEASDLVGLISKVNQVRRQHPALQFNDTLRFLQTDNEQLIAYAKSSGTREDIVLTVVNLDPHHTQRGFITLPLESWGLRAQDTYQVHDLLTGAHFLWTGASNYVELDPRFVPAHILHLRRYVRTERDFDYFM